jgi:hypothetical protein
MTMIFDCNVFCYPYTARVYSAFFENKSRTTRPGPFHLNSAYISLDPFHAMSIFKKAQKYVLSICFSSTEDHLPYANPARPNPANNPTPTAMTYASWPASSPTSPTTESWSPTGALPKPTHVRSSTSSSVDQFRTSGGWNDPPPTLFTKRA